MARAGRLTAHRTLRQPDTTRTTTRPQPPLCLYTFLSRSLAKSPPTLLPMFRSTREGHGLWDTPRNRPELWFGSTPDDDGSDGAAKHAPMRAVGTQARIMPAGARSYSSAGVLNTRSASGGDVWAGIKLPGGQYRKARTLAAAHDVRPVAGSEIN